MGQKVNPLSFHLKQNTIYNNIWYNKYKYNIFKYFIIKSLIKKHNIKLFFDLKILITNKYTEINFITTKNYLNLFKYNKLFIILNYKLSNIKIFPYFRFLVLNTPYIYPKYIIYYLKTQLKFNNTNLRKLLKIVSNLIFKEKLTQNIILGVKFQISGKLNPNLQAYTENFSIGQLNLHTKKTWFLYEEDFIKNTKGILGIKLWINFI